MSPSLSDSDWNVLRRLLADVAELRTDRGVPFGVASRAGEFLPKLALRLRPPLAREARPPRGESATARKKRLREEAWARDGRCGARGFLGIRCSGPPELHHVHGRGAGRAPEDVTTVEILCQRHHRLATANSPSRMAWLERHRNRALVFGYGEEVARTERAIALEKGQHPEEAVAR